MGGHDEWLAFLLKIFPHCFTSELEENTHFDTCIVDGTQFLAQIRQNKPGSSFDAKYLSYDMVSMVYHYMNNENDKSRPIIDKSTVILLDTVSHVTKNKASTQQDRDNTDNNDEDDDDDNNNNNNNNSIKELNVILNEETYENLIKELNIDYNDLIIHKDMLPCKSICGNTIWRSHNLRWQLNTMVITEMMINVEVPRNKILVIDDGVIFHSREEYKKLRRQMFEDTGFQNKSPYEQEVLVSLLINSSTKLNYRYMIHHDKKMNREESTQMGESDIKICNHIFLFDKDGKKHPMRRYLVVSQDSDIIFILLAHMKRLINPETKEIDDDIGIFVDRQTPTMKRKNISNAHRFVNIKELYYSIIKLFNTEYPTIAYPIETLLFLVNSLNTDYTDRLGDKYLGITRSVVWNVFSELHHRGYTSNNEYLKDEEVTGYIVFDKAGKKKSDKLTIKRSTVIHYSDKIRNVLGGDAIVCTYCEETTEYKIHLDFDKIEQFFYFLCQLKLVDDMKSIQVHSNNTTSNSKAVNSRTKKETAFEIKPYYPDHNVLFIYANDILSNIAKFKDTKNATLNASTKILLLNNDNKTGGVVNKNKNITPPPKRKVVSTNMLDKSYRPIIADIGPAISFTPTNQQLNQLKLADLASKNIPDRYSIPTRLQMKGRIHRINWILGFWQNATISNDFAKCYLNKSTMDQRLSIHGWQAKPLPPNAINVNCSYYKQLYKSALLGNMPVIVFAVEETDNIF